MTLFAATFQEAGLVSLFQQWMTHASNLCVSAGEANLHILLGYLGLQVYLLPASLLLLCLLGFWVYRYRHRDIWLLIGVSALIARFWSYHRWYDDLLNTFAHSHPVQDCEKRSLCFENGSAGRSAAFYHIIVHVSSGRSLSPAATVEHGLCRLTGCHLDREPDIFDSLHTQKNGIVGNLRLSTSKPALDLPWSICYPETVKKCSLLTFPQQGIKPFVVTSTIDHRGKKVIFRPMNRPSGIIIIGAGPSGMACAYTLAQKGSASCVVDRDDRVGGLCQTIDFAGNLFDIGGHRFLSKSALITNSGRRSSEIGC